MNSLTRRDFVKRTTVLGAAAALSPSLLRAAGANEKIVVAMVGCNGRGMDHLASILAQPNVEVGYLCDVDDNALQKGLKAIAKKQAKVPKTVKDFRRALEDRDVDAISLAVPNHWHAPAAILGCSAGKHVYVEKPGSHNPHEGELLVAAIEKSKRIVQMGNQRRGWPWIQEAVAKVQAGEVGEIKFARSWYNNKREPIGHGKQVPVPSTLDYSMWQGPAPERPYVDNLVHYNWHWRWHWGNGELGNNGIHYLDVARWALKLGYPKRVTCSGGRYHYQDDWETPDTYVVGYDFGNVGLTWEGHSCHPRGFEGETLGITFYGTKGAIVMGSKNWKVYDFNGKLVSEGKGEWSNVEQFVNWFDCIRNNTPEKLLSPVAECQKSTLLCHLGNIAYRTGHTLNIDPKTGKILNDAEAQALWSREYRPGWEPKI